MKPPNNSADDEEIISLGCRTVIVKSVEGLPLWVVPQFNIMGLSFFFRSVSSTMTQG